MYQCNNLEQLNINLKRLIRAKFEALVGNNEVEVARNFG